MRAIVITCLVFACAKQPTITTVRAAHYDAELAVVYAEMKAGVADTKRTVVDEEPAVGRFRTGWEDIELLSSNSRVLGKFRLRFEIHVAGTRPWRVEVRPITDPADAPMDAISISEERIERAIHARLARFDRH